jgi:hypothetical protein
MQMGNRNGIRETPGSFDNRKNRTVEIRNVMSDVRRGIVHLYSRWSFSSLVQTIVVTDRAPNALPHCRPHSCLRGEVLLRTGTRKLHEILYGNANYDE